MKKKIIYISGAEVFDIEDVKSAFEEVRTALKLDSDTILFGVPVESEIAGVSTESVDDTDDICKCVDCGDDRVCEYVDEVANEPKQPEFIDESESDNDTDDTEETPEPDISAKENDTESDETVVPILSVLAAKQPDVEPEQDGPESQKEIIENTDLTDVVPTNISVKTEITHTVTVNSEIENMSDMINDDVPVAETEKTLEELLESMTPLQEDVQPEPIKSESVETGSQTDEIDITLENLASEFAEKEDKIVPQKKNSERGKIGKLKNILPFKKMKRDDSSLMGDLFGWAGVAANDDDFSMPGFFTNAK